MTNMLAVAALIASQIGAPLPADAPAVIVPTAAATVVPAARAAAASGSVSATGNLSGSTSMQCNSGWMNGWVNLTAQMQVSGPDGTHGTVPVSGQVHLSGSCQNGSGGFVSGSASVSGYGTMYSREGRRAGTVRLNASVFINQHVSEFAWINQYATVHGYFTADPAN